MNETNKKGENFTDCKPIGSLATKQIIDLEHKYRLLLKKHGFQDIEAWDNKPRQKVKKVKFIKGHVRFERINRKGFIDKYQDTFEFFRVIGLYAYNAKKFPKTITPETTYKAILQDYSLTGNLTTSVRNVKDKGIKVPTVCAVSLFITKYFPQMLKFVNNMESKE